MNNVDTQKAGAAPEAAKGRSGYLSANGTILIGILGLVIALAGLFWAFVSPQISEILDRTAAIELKIDTNQTALNSKIDKNQTAMHSKIDKDETATNERLDKVNDRLDRIVGMLGATSARNPSPSR